MMLMDPRLLIFNSVYCVSIVLSVGIAGYAFVRGRGVRGAGLFGVACLSMAFFEAVNLVGLNSADQGIANTAFLITGGAVITACFNLHWILAALGKSSEKKRTLAFFYSVAAVLWIFFALFPVVFLDTSSPALYFPNYQNPGPLHFLFIVFIVITFIYASAVMMRVHVHAGLIVRNKTRYFFGSLIVTYFLAGLFLLPAYGVGIDPVLSGLAFLGLLPAAYALLRTDILDIQTAGKQILVYGLVIFCLVLLFEVAGAANAAAAYAMPDFPEWIIPLTISLLLAAVGGIIWRRIRFVESLKYDFITVITHKFRTPLTHVKWALDEFKRSDIESDRAEAIDEIQSANVRLVDLTDILIGLIQVDASDYLYHLEKVDPEPLIRRVIEGVNIRAREKRIRLEFSTETSVPPISVDTKRIQFALQIIIENAISYTPEGGTVTVALGWHNGGVTFTIHDTGIGISPEELPHIFSKFYRGPRAKAADTEGMGIGLYMARNIIERHGGKIYADSAGVGQGTTFSIKLPGSPA